jgi:hypothetical protein
VNPRPSSRARLALGALAAGLVTMAIASTASSQSAATPIPVTIKGSGSWGPNYEMKAWQDALFEKSPAQTDMRYGAHGSQLGRADLLHGDVDFVFSGIPFTDDELKQLPNGKSDLVDVPMQVSSLAFLVAAPYPNGFLAQTQIPNCDPDDPPDPQVGCFTRTPYAGALTIPPTDLAAMLVNFPGTCPNPPPALNPDPHLPLNSWTCRSVTEAFGLGSQVTWVGMNPSAGPVPILRSDPDETSYYLQRYVKEAAPTEVWDKLVQDGQHSDPVIDWEPISERFPRLTKVASRDGANQQAGQLAFPSLNPITGGFSNQTAGLIADIPASATKDAKDQNPNVAFVSVRNKHGEHVAPTPDSINKAVEAGGDVPLHALTNSVADAYPLVWIDHLYVNTKAANLTAEKVEALASMIRYLATDGQAVGATVGEGKLSTSLADQAIAGADDLVQRACPTSSGATIVSNTEPGPYAPALPGVQGIGTMKHCQAAVTTTTTVPVAASGTGSPTATVPPATSATPSGVSPTPTPTLSPLPTTPAVATTPQVSAATATNSAAKGSAKRKAETVVELPLPEEDTHGFDRLALGTLGAGAFLVLRNPIRRLLRPGTL